MLDKYPRSIGSYKLAIEVEPLNTLAYKGLQVLSERRKAVPDYIDATGGLIACLQQKNEMAKALEALESAKKLARKNSSEMNDMAILRFQLPGSPIFEYMEGRLPHPAATYAKLIDYTEKSQNKALSKYTSRNTARLNAKDSKAHNDLVYEIYYKSKVSGFTSPHVYYTNSCLAPRVV